MIVTQMDVLSAEHQALIGEIVQISGHIHRCQHVDIDETGEKSQMIQCLFVLFIAPGKRTETANAPPETFSRSCLHCAEIR